MKYAKFLLNLVFIAMIFPLAILVMWCFSACWSYPNLVPESFSLRGFEYLFEPGNITTMLQSIFIAVIVSMITVIICIPASKAIALYKFKGKKFFRLLVMSPMIIPMVSIAMGIHIGFLRMKIANSIIGVVIINIIPCIPYAVMILSDVYRIHGDRLEVRAEILGAGKFDTFRYITFPSILPGIISAATMSFIVSFGQYFLTMLIGGGKIVTYPMIMFPYIQSGDRNLSSVYSVYFLIVTMIMVFIIQRMLRKTSVLCRIEER